MAATVSATRTRWTRKFEKASLGRNMNRDKGFQPVRCVSELRILPVMRISHGLKARVTSVGIL
jgi:hypothetical protein